MFKVVRLLSLFLVVLILAPGAAFAAEAPALKVVATVYPLYVTALNIARDVPGVQLDVLIPSSAGCGHDYQLTTEDMRRVEGANLLLYVGLDLEGYLPNIQAAYPDLPMLPTSVNFEPLEEHHEGLDGEEHENPHVWMDPQIVMETAKEIARYFSSVDEANSALYQQNLDAYLAKLTELDTSIETMFAGVENKTAVAYHGGFSYFARRYGFTVAEDIAHSEDEQPSSGRVAEIIELMKAENIPMLWLETAEEAELVSPIADETGATALVLDLVTFGDLDDYDIYLRALQSNAELILGAAS